MIDPRRAQLSFGDRLIAEEVDGLYEEWMVHADEVLADEAIVMAAYEALAKRHRLSRTRGRRGFCAEVVVRLLVLKHARNWSYAVLEREVRANHRHAPFAHGLGIGHLGHPDAGKLAVDERGRRSSGRPTTGL
jgi:hypothetical protein